MKTHPSIQALAALVLCASGGAITTSAAPSVEAPRKAPTLAEARKGFSSNLTKREAENAGRAIPAPKELYDTIQYNAPLGKQDAYVSIDPKDGKKHPAIIWLCVAGMFDEASAVESVAEVLIESMCTGSMVAAGHLDTETSVRPGELLDRGNEQPAGPAPVTLGCDDETRDATQKPVSVKERNTVKGDDTDNAFRRLGNKSDSAGRRRAILDASLNLRDR